VHVTGPLGIAADSSDAFAGIGSTLLYAALAVVIVLLLLTYRSPALWLLPVASVGVALALLALMVAELNSTSGMGPVRATAEAEPRRRTAPRLDGKARVPAKGLPRVRRAAPGGH